jgi:IMP dehydrogenase
MLRKEFERSLKYSDVFIVPAYSEISSRSVIDTSTKLGKLVLDVPVISANMETVTQASTAIAIRKAGGIGALHRYSEIADNVSEYLQVKNLGLECFVSVGVNHDSKDRAERLYEAGARYFIIDIAHGHSLAMKTMVKYLKDKYHDIFVMGGNVATPEGVADLEFWGCDSVKVGIAGGGVCTTKNVTGVHVPMFSCLYACYSAATKPLVADGGIKEYGDIAKALGMADLVMCGGMFAGCKEAPGERIGNKKVYRGMASRDAAMTSKEIVLRYEKTGHQPTPEGREILIDATDTSIVQIVKEIRGALKSSFSYCNAKSLQEFQAKINYGTFK